MMNVNGFSLRTDMSEFTLKEFSVISGFLNDERTFDFEKYIDIIQYLGMTDEQIDKITDDLLFQIIHEFDRVKKFDGKVYNRTLIIGGKEYYSYEEGSKFVMKARDLSTITRAINLGKTDWVTFAISVIFKDPNLENIRDHYIPAHLTYKTNLFGDNVMAGDVYQYLVYLIDKVAEQKNLLIDKTDAK